VGGRDDTLSTIYFTYPQLLTTLDFRDSRQHPRKGFYLSNTLESAFLGMAKDFKVQPDARVYVPIVKRLTIAARGSVGFDFPRSYGAVVEDPVLGQQKSVENTKDYQLTYFRGFFSGGPSSNRGYPLRGVSPYAEVPFLSPESQAQRVANGCDPSVPATYNRNNDCRSPTGGFTLWELSLESRININGPLSAVLFCDASDVAPQTAQIRLDHPHLSCGAGGRYDTPVGPVRLDVGYRIPGLQILANRTHEDRVADDIFGIPIAVSFGIGEAF
jgi:outer membrane protein insertion porin family/translocation and assembly module TamA